MRYFSISLMIMLPIVLSGYTKTEFKKTDHQFESIGSKESMVFEEIDHSINNRTENEKCTKFEIVAAEYKLIMSLNKGDETAQLILDKRIVKTDFNFIYDTDLESAIGEIKLLKSKMNDDIILFLPIATEEFATFQIIKYEPRTKTFRNGIFTINTHKYDNIINFYLTNSITLNLVKNKFEISIGDFNDNGEFRKMKSSNKVASC